MNICVTGGAGFIGSHLVDRLVELGHKVLVIDNLSTGSRELINSECTFLEMDVRDSKIEQVFHDFSIEYVFHEAAQTMVPISMENPKLDCDVNLMGLINVLEACRKTGVKKIITPSSAAVYGDLDELPLTEEKKGVPTSFYGLTKSAVEDYLRLYEQTFRMPYICFRYSNVYGPRQGNGGEGGVISIFANNVVQNKGLVVFGDGTQTRDFIYVDDVVEANLATLRVPEVTGIYNVSTNEEVSLTALVEAFRAIAGEEVVVSYEEERLGDIKHSCLDNTKLKEELFCEPKINLTTGLLKTYHYFKEKNK